MCLWCTIWHGCRCCVLFITDYMEHVAVLEENNKMSHSKSLKTGIRTCPRWSSLPPLSLKHAHRFSFSALTREQRFLLRKSPDTAELLISQAPKSNSGTERAEERTTCSYFSLSEWIDAKYSNLANSFQNESTMYLSSGFIFSCIDQTLNRLTKRHT